jgi:hypothetical protein
VAQSLAQSRLREWDDILADGRAGANTGPYQFIPVFEGVVQSGQALQWSSPCFASNTATLTSLTQTGLSLQISSSSPQGCSDYYIFATRMGGWFHSVSGASTSFNATFSASDAANEWDDITHNGLQVYVLPLGLQGTIASAYATAELFASGPLFQEKNVAWLEQVAPTLWAYKKRAGGAISVPEAEIPDGTHFIISRLDGVSGSRALSPSSAVRASPAVRAQFETMTQWGVGAWSGHHAIAFRSPADGKLYVHESTDVPPGTDVYWPPPYGVIRTGRWRRVPISGAPRRAWPHAASPAEYSQWIAQAEKAQYMVNIAPLSDASQAKFNASAAEAAFMAIQGLPYGYHNFIFEWIDQGILNLPWKPSSPAIAALLFNMLDNRLANDTKTSCYSLVLQAMNHRLGQQFNSMNDLWLYYESQGVTDVFNQFAEDIDLPEEDDWVYVNNQSWCNSLHQGPCVGASRICDTFVFTMYKAAGVLDPFDIQATEFTPRDSYQIAIYNSTWAKPAACKDSFAGYCQLMGAYEFELPGFNSLPLVDHMNEKCGALPPLYTRTPTVC